MFIHEHLLPVVYCSTREMRSVDTVSKRADWKDYVTVESVLRQCVGPTASLLAIR